MIQIPAFPLSNAILAAFFAMLVVLFIRWTRMPASKTSFDAADFFMEDGKASGHKLVVFGMAVLAGWVVVKKTLAGADVETLLLGVLTIFVLRSMVGKVVDGFGKGENR